eukprot:12890842-Prorocentrum_lima.AAC.1
MGCIINASQLGHQVSRDRQIKSVQKALHGCEGDLDTEDVILHGCGLDSGLSRVIGNTNYHLRNQWGNAT